MILNNTNTSIEVLLGGAITANQLQCIATWVDLPAANFASGQTATVTNSTTPVELIPACDDNTRREVRYVSVFNADSASATVTIRYNVVGVYSTIQKFTLPSGYTLVYNKESGWSVYSTTGTVIGTSTTVLPDGTYGDIVVSSSGTVMTLLASINKTITGEWSFRYDKFFLYNAAATFYHKLRSLATATRTVTFPDFDGTVCLQNTMFITGGDQTTTANTAQNITELVTASLSANTRWRFRGFISLGCNNTGGVKFAVVIPTAATVQLGLIGRDSSATTTINAAISASATLSPAFNSVNAANGRLWIEGEVAIGANAGTVQFQFASTTAGQTSTIYQLGTGITYMQIT